MFFNRIKLYFSTENRHSITLCDVFKYKSQIIKPNCSSICHRSLTDIIRTGVEAMRFEKFKLANTKLDI